MEKSMTITYTVGDALYVNITNRCSNRCDFCIRNNGDGAYGSDPLWLAHEPTVEEVLADIESRDLSLYSELVFCGYGEPTERLNELLQIAKCVKEKHSLPVRVNTNGQSSLISGCDTAPMFKDVIDTVSISLNAPNAAEYQRICHSVFGEAAFDAVIAFAKEVKKYVSDVIMTVVDVSLAEDEIAKCKEIAENADVVLRVRKYIGK